MNEKVGSPAMITIYNNTTMMVPRRPQTAQVNLLFNANADAPEAVHRLSQMKNPKDMKNGDRRAARIYNTHAACNHSVSENVHTP